MTFTQYSALSPIKQKLFNKFYWRWSRVRHGIPHFFKSVFQISKCCWKMPYTIYSPRRITDKYIATPTLFDKLKSVASFIMCSALFRPYYSSVDIEFEQNKERLLLQEIELDAVCRGTLKLEDTKFVVKQTSDFIVHI